MAGSWFCRGLGPQKSGLALQNGDTQPPLRSFFGRSDYIDFTKTGNVEQELPLQNGFLYISGFSGETGRPRFFHIIPLQNGPLYFWRFSFFQVAILLKCLLMPGSPLCRGQCFWKSKECTKKQGVGRPDFVKKTPRFVAGSSFCRGPSSHFFDSLSACKGVQGQVPDFVVGAFWCML